MWWRQYPRRNRIISLGLIFVLLMTACSSPDKPQEASGPSGPLFIPSEVSTESPVKTAKAPEAPTISSTSQETVTTDTPEPTSKPPTPEILPTQTATTAPLDLALSEEGIWLYPTPSIYEGDLVTIQINPNVPSRLAPNDVDVKVYINGEELLTGNLNWRNLNGDSSGLYQWVWDTSNTSGLHSLSAILDPDDLIQIGDEEPDNNEAEIVVNVQPRSDLSELQSSASWITVENDCCNIHVVSSTAAHRDLDFLLEQVETAFEHASAALTEPLAKRYDVYLIDRVIGQGGYASDAMVVSYLDRDYAGSGIYEVLVHEAVHLLDKQFAPDRISFLSEGLAVWATGGHYQQENINQKMAGVVEGGLYVPIDRVADEIYSLQHELSYLESASFISYLIETYGWDRVRAFYVDTGADDAPTLAEAVNENLINHFERSLSQVENDWIAFLARQPRDRSAVANLRSTIRYYDVMRRYQQAYDPSAYYLNAWLPPPREAQEANVTADLTRHPETAVNIALEAILLSSKDALVSGEYRLANAYLDTVERVLNNDGRFLDPLADSYINIVRTAKSNGYEVQKISLLGDQAAVLAVRDGEVELTEITLELVDNSTWALMR